MTPGRPKAFATPEEMEQAIQAYFDACDSHTKQVMHPKTGNLIEVPAPRPYTVEGLCRVLDIDRKTLLEYGELESHAEFRNTVKKAKLFIQEKKVEGMLSGDYVTAGAIFDLKNNHGYVDRSELTGKDGTPIIPEAEVDKKINELLRKVANTGRPPGAEESPA